jgi:hypothetical protein
MEKRQIKDHTINPTGGGDTYKQWPVLVDSPIVQVVSLSYTTIVRVVYSPTPRVWVQGCECTSKSVSLQGAEGSRYRV